MKKELPTMLTWFFITMIIILFMSSCVSIRQTCPSNDKQYFYKQARIKPFYNRH